MASEGLQREWSVRELGNRENRFPRRLAVDYGLDSPCFFLKVLVKNIIPELLREYEVGSQLTFLEYLMKESQN